MESKFPVETIFQMIQVSYDHFSMARDYDQSGDIMSMVETHVLTAIDEQPGITTTELSEQFRRTKGAISQTVKKLEQKKLVYKETDDEHRKIMKIYATDKGELKSRAHTKFDERSMANMEKYIREKCSTNDIEVFTKVLTEILAYLSQEIE